MTIHKHWCAYCLDRCVSSNVCDKPECLAKRRQDVCANAGPRDIKSSGLTPNERKIAINSTYGKQERQAEAKVSEEGPRKSPEYVDHQSAYPYKVANTTSVKTRRFPIAFPTLHVGPGGTSSVYVYSQTIYRGRRLIAPPGVSTKLYLRQLCVGVNAQQFTCEPIPLWTFAAMSLHDWDTMMVQVQSWRAGDPASVITKEMSLRTILTEMKTSEPGYQYSATVENRDSVEHAVDLVIDGTGFFP